jgi:hypothetical protein
MKSHSLFVSSKVETIDIPSFKPQFVLIFSTQKAAQVQAFLDRCQKQFPDSVLLGCSTAGNISGIRMSEDDTAITFISSEKGQIKPYWRAIDSVGSMNAGKLIADDLSSFPELNHVYVLSEGLFVNGSELANGMRESLHDGVNVTGGLAGDGNNFENTWVIDQNGKAQSGICCAIGFYGKEWQVKYGSQGGWNAFGMERLVTKSSGSTLYEIDGEPALKLYKSYLGERSSELPASGLLFPLSMRLNADDPPLVRTILSVDEESQSLTFAGDIPEGSFVKLMKANVDRLIDGAGQAGHLANEIESGSDLAILVSCVGRKLVLKQMVEEEIEAVQDELKAKCITGFYSYGELAPFRQGLGCELHNQTMTVTTITERI